MSTAGDGLGAITVNTTHKPLYVHAPILHSQPPSSPPATRQPLTRVDVAHGVVPRVPHPAAGEDEGEAVGAHGAPVRAEVNGHLQGQG